MADLNELVRKLKSQIGDDVREIYLHDALFKAAADAIEAQAREIAALTARVEAAEAKVAHMPPQMDSDEARELQRLSGTRHMPTALTFDARLAIAGKGPLAAEWQDKKHRLVFDLCQEIERIAAGASASLSPRQSVCAALSEIGGW